MCWKQYLYALSHRLERYVEGSRKAAIFVAVKLQLFIQRIEVMGTRAAIVWVYHILSISVIQHG